MFPLLAINGVGYGDDLCIDILYYFYGTLKFLCFFLNTVLRTIFLFWIDDN